MRTGVVISLATSLALGAGALVIAKVWGSAPARTPAGSAQAAPAPTVPVVVANAAIAYGEPIPADKLSVVRMPAGMAPQGAFSSIAEIEGAGAIVSGGKPQLPVALTPIVAHEMVLAPMVTGPGGRSSVSSQIALGMRAYAIRISDVSGVGGHALPGDRVDVVLTREPARRPGAPVVDHDMVSDVIVQDVKLMGVNLNADPTSGPTQAAADPKTATLEVSLQDAEKLALAGGVGTLSLALRRVGSGADDTGQVRQLVVNDLGSQGGALIAQPTLRRVHAPARRIQPVTDGRASVLIVQGEKNDSVSVPAEKRKGA